MLLHINNNKEKVNTCRMTEQALLSTAFILVKSASGGFEELSAPNSKKVTRLLRQR